MQTYTIRETVFASVLKDEVLVGSMTGKQGDYLVQNDDVMVVLPKAAFEGIFQPIGEPQEETQEEAHQKPSDEPIPPSVDTADWDKLQPYQKVIMASLNAVDRVPLSTLTFNISKFKNSTIRNAMPVLVKLGLAKVETQNKIKLYTLTKKGSTIKYYLANLDQLPLEAPKELKEPVFDKFPEAFQDIIRTLYKTKNKPLAATELQAHTIGKNLNLFNVQEVAKTMTSLGILKAKSGPRPDGAPDKLYSLTKSGYDLYSKHKDQK